MGSLFGAVLFISKVELQYMYLTIGEILFAEGVLWS